MSEYILELKNITKTFPGVKALDNVQFQLKPGEIHALMGENGAGKSTFIKVITGVHQPDSGQIYLDGKEVVFPDPIAAQNAGIEVRPASRPEFRHLKENNPTRERGGGVKFWRA